MAQTRLTHRFVSPDRAAPATTAAPRQRPLNRRAYLVGSVAVVCGALAGCLGRGPPPADDDAGGQDPDVPPDDDRPDDDADADDDRPAEAAVLGRVIRFEESYTYAFEFTHTETGDVFRSTGRYDAGDSYARIENPDGSIVEIYFVGNAVYTVDGDACFVMDVPEIDDDFAEEYDPDVSEFEDVIDEHELLEAVGRDTIDGEAMYVFVLSDEDDEMLEEAITMYVSVETGYLRRLEGAGSVLEFLSWGDVDPITAPDMPCTSYDDFGS